MLGEVIDALQRLDLDGLDSAEVLALVDELEREARRLRSVQLAVMAEVDRRGLHRADGHASAKVLVRHRGQLPGGEALGREKSMRALRELPEIAAAFEAGEVGSIVDAASEVIETGGRPERGPRQRRRRRSGRAPPAQPQPGKCRAAEGTCEIDHLDPHGHGGRTNPANGAPLCGRHNRWKQKGFTVGRDPDGTYQTLRPDRTQLE